ncbi:F0F1 ATP synthase subunit alpha [Candidatus Uhrbacteria bacterium]|jgi:F-type H+/Na+-transporting ATPase subunit alpha|nr:F0F1 ATP synthase subunit alpha [Candidatus Uhrbacteria bacterium]
MSDKKTLQQFFSSVDAAIRSVESADGNEAKAGVIRSVKDGVVHIYGLLGLKMGEVVRIEEAGVDALVMQLDGRNAYAVQLQASLTVAEGQSVVSTGNFLGIDVSEKFLGRVVNPVGVAQDENGKLKGDKFMPLEKIAPGVMTREPVSEPVQTGILSIDSMIPIGRGQRELIIGDRQTGKTSIAIDTILNQKGQDMVCVYVACGQRESSTANVVRKLQENGAMDYTVVVSAGAASPAVMQYLAPYAGAAVAEYFMDLGRDVLVVYDDLSKHAVAYRELSLLLRRPPGREAYPGDVFYLHSRLLERAARLNEQNGGGSMTALPIVETQAGDVSAYIPTNVISITDGQIFLQSDLFHSGIRPAINIGISVSRVGGAAQTKIMKKISGSAKLDLAQYYELAAFTQFASDLDDSTKQQLLRGERVQEAMKQPELNPYSLWQEVVVLRAATGGFLDSVEIGEVRKALENLLTRVSAEQKDLVKAIETEKKLTDEIKAQLETVIGSILTKE